MGSSLPRMLTDTLISDMRKKAIRTSGSTRALWRENRGSSRMLLVHSQLRKIEKGELLPSLTRNFPV